jgi:hypothetical protein
VRDTPSLAIRVRDTLRARLTAGLGGHLRARLTAGLGAAMAADVRLARAADVRLARAASSQPLGSPRRSRTLPAASRSTLLARLASSTSFATASSHASPVRSLSPSPERSATKVFPGPLSLRDRAPDRSLRMIASA